METQGLLQLAKLLSEHRKLKLSTLGVYSVNDGTFFARIGAGSTCTLRTAAKVCGWFDANWPADLEWPKAIPRPSTEKRAA